MSKANATQKLCECGCGEPAPIAHKTISARGIRKGDPLRFVYGHQNRSPLRWAREDRGYETPCWIWKGTRNAKGYGLGWDQQLAHRQMWAAAHGAIPGGLCVLHRCDVPSCVNPDHLFLGTQADNIADMIAKGRDHKSSGEAHHRATLTSVQVEAIRQANGVPYRKLAAIAGVSTSTISHIKNGYTRRNG